MSDKLITALGETKHILKISRIEQDLGLRKNHLHSVINGDLYRSLKGEERKAVRNYLKKFCKVITTALADDIES